MRTWSAPVRSAPIGILRRWDRWSKRSPASPRSSSSTASVPTRYPASICSKPWMNYASSSSRTAAMRESMCTGRCRKNCRRYGPIVTASCRCCSISSRTANGRSTTRRTSGSISRYRPTITPFCSASPIPVRASAPQKSFFSPFNTARSPPGWGCFCRAPSCGRSTASCGTIQPWRAARSSSNWPWPAPENANSRAWRNMEPIRLLLLDDHVLFRESLGRLLASEPDFAMAGHCGTSAEALDILQKTPVDVILLDYDLGDDHGAQFLEAALRAGYRGKTLMVTAGMSATESSLALKLGASGIFLKHNSPGSLAQAIRQVAAGEMWVDPKVIQSLADNVSFREEHNLRRLLTEREQEVLQGLFEGFTNKEIAAQLGVSESAVKATLQQLFQKTHVRTRSQLVRIALESSLGTTRR